MWKLIALEEHCASPGFIQGPGHIYRTRTGAPTSPAEQMFDTLCEVGEQRVAAMDAAGIAMQVFLRSLT